MSRITIRELAEACGVSIATVSKALNRSERISEETIRRITAKAEELGYVGNRAARALSRGRRRIGFLLPTSSGELAERYRIGIRAAIPALEARGIELCELFDAPSLDGVDALLLPTSLLAGLTLPEDLPIATVGSRASALHPVTEVTADYRIGGRLAAQFLAFATAGAPTAVLSARRTAYAEEEAIRGFRELSSRLGTSVSAVVECGDGARGVYTEMRRLLVANPRVKGIFVSAPMVGAVSAAAGELRRRLTVIGADFSRPAIEALRAGSVAALLYPSPERQTEAALLGLCEHLETGRAPGLVTVRQELVLKSNLESYMCNI